MVLRRRILLLLLLGTLAGCGFTPLYGTTGAGAGPGADLGQVSVALIPNREGQELRQALQDRLEAGGGGTSSRYDLYVSLALADGALAITQESGSTRIRVTGTASWTLKGQDAAHTTLASGAAHALDGYNVINQQFFQADLSQGSTNRRVDEALADQITQQLAVYFKQHP